MGSRKNRNKNNQRQQQRQQPASNAAKAGNTQNGMPVKPAEEVKPITLDDVKVSTSQAEFESKKEQLIQQLVDEISGWEDSKKTAETAAQEAQKALEQMNSQSKEMSFRKRSKLFKRNILRRSRL